MLTLNREDCRERAVAEMPAVLLEVGYLNFQRDNDLFDRYYEEYAEAAAGAIYGWLKDTVVR